MARFIVPVSAGIVALAGIAAAVICFVRKHHQASY